MGAPGSTVGNTTTAILIAEDEAVVRFAISDSLADCGFTVFEAGNADEAIEVLENEPTIELVFTDIRMPGRMNGLGLAQWVHEHRPGLAVILTSGEVRKSDLPPRECFAAKPYNVESVIAQIRVLTCPHRH